MLYKRASISTTLRAGRKGIRRAREIGLFLDGLDRMPHPQNMQDERDDAPPDASRARMIVSCLPYWADKVCGERETGCPRQRVLHCSDRIDVIDPLPGKILEKPLEAIVCLAEIGVMAHSCLE